MADAQTSSAPAMTVLRGGPVPPNHAEIPTLVSAPGFVEGLLPVPPPPSRDLSGSLLLDRYRLIKKLGEGGMGTVYLAEHVTIKKRCAIKLLNPEYAHKQDLVERFLQEARAASMIAHENVVEITDFGAAPNGSVFFVMEMLIGEDLSETIRRDAPLPWSRVKPMALQICRALGAAHDKGIIHRDMKPENCFRIERSGNADFIKVLDFGIAKVTSEDPDGTGGRLTSTGMIFGTPTYMSPEQAQGSKVDLRSDIYAVGVILYELLTGKVPFSADNFMGILTKHMFDDPPAPSAVAPEANIDPEVEAVVLKALQKERAYRYASMQEFAAAILAVGTGAEPPTVIPEARPRPVSGGQPTEFLGRPRTGPVLAPAAPTGEVTLAEPPAAPRRRGLGVALLLGAVVLGGGVTALVMAGGDTPAPQAPAVAAPASEPVPKASPEPTPPAPPPVEAPGAPAEVRVYVASNVPAEVVDAADGTVLGHSGDAGLLLPAGGGPRKVVVRAAGHEDAPLELAATEGGRFEAQLRPKKKAGKPGKAETKAEPKPGDPRPEEPKPADTKPGGSFGLKNPFETRGG
jgi:serine/threonine-protein kinase